MHDHPEQPQLTRRQAIAALLLVELALLAVPLLGLFAGAVPGARHGELLVHRATAPGMFWFTWSCWLALALFGVYLLARVLRSTKPRGGTRPH